MAGSASVATPPQIQGEREMRVTFHRRYLHRSGRVADCAETSQAPALRLVGVDREHFVGSSPGMAYVIGAAPNRPPRPSVHNIKYQWCMYRNVGMQAGWRLPGTV